MNDLYFQSALPVWGTGRRFRMNDFILFTADFSAQKGQNVSLVLTASTYFRVKLNGCFVAHGPARGPKGFFRVETLPLACRSVQNHLEIEVSGANINSFDYLDQPSFLQAEVKIGDTVVAATGKDFRAFDLTHERIVKVSRLSYQRLFFEAYRVTPERGVLPELELEVTPDVSYLPARVPQPEYAIDRSYRKIKTLRRSYRKDAGLLPDAAPGTAFGVSGTQGVQNRALTLVGKNGFKGYHQEELDVNAFLELGRYVRDDKGEIVSTLFAGKINNTGFVQVRVNCTKPGRLVVMFAELEEPSGGVDPLRLETTCAVFWDLLTPGYYDLEAIEPNAFKYAEVFFDGGEGDICDLALREYKSPLVQKNLFTGNDAELKAIFDAGCESFAANAVDVLTDCPTRERGGYIGDSFFTSRAAHSLTGNLLLETLFLENYALAAADPGLPRGVFPMEYPGDHPTGEFIPNWGMWLLLELAEYRKRGGGQRILDAMRGKVFDFIGYMDHFLNEDGLLEKLPGWVFVEWSLANTFTQDVNYPTNMLYAAALDAAAQVYGETSLRLRAREMREKILAQSWDGHFFRDHAVRQKDGTLQVAPGDKSEICQYFAFFHHLATPEKFPGLWHTLVADFGPRRKAEGNYPDVAFANAIMGNYLRLELLATYGLQEQMLREIKDYFLPMAQTTGTLWEHNDTRASCCHGISSFISYLILQYHSSKKEFAR